MRSTNLTKCRSSNLALLIVCLLLHRESILAVTKLMDGWIRYGSNAVESSMEFVYNLWNFVIVMSFTGRAQTINRKAKPCTLYDFIQMHGNVTKLINLLCDA